MQDFSNVVCLLQVIGESWFYIITYQILSCGLFKCAFVLFKFMYVKGGIVEMIRNE